LFPVPKNQGYELSNHLKSIFVAGGVLLGVLCVIPQASAISLGPMLVKSSFGERFDAEIELSAGEVKDLKVSIGSEADYSMLELQRPAVVDRLFIKYPLEVREGKVVLHVMSRRSLFYPAFNLVIKVQQSGGTLFENYLISVDFQQSVSLRLKASRDSEPADPEKVPEVLPGGEESARSRQPSPKDSDKAVSAKPAFDKTAAPQIAGIHPTPLVVHEPAQPKYPFTRPLPVPPVSVAQAPPKKKIETPPSPPTPVVQEAPDPKPELVVQEARAPSVPKGPDQPRSQNQPVAGTQVLTGRIQGSFGPVESGDTLSKIVQRLQFKSSDALRVAAALWLDNQDKFVNNNIHGLKKGAILNMERLKERIQSIKSWQARWIIKNHWQEWKLIQARKITDVRQDMNPELQKILIPKEDTSVKEKVLKTVNDWKGSWEKGDLEGHMALFSKDNLNEADRSRDGGFDYWHRFKKMMFSRHRNVRIEIHQPTIILLESKARVGFDQTFESDRMKSFGRKVIELSFTEGTWKIRKEIFSVKQFWDKQKMPKPLEGKEDSLFKPMQASSYPYVVHASTQIDLVSANQLVNNLRQLGFNAYSAPLYVGRNRKIFRVFVGRLGQWEAAEELAEMLRKTAFTPYAIPMAFPYALEVGEFLDEEQAKGKMSELHNRGLSPFLFSPEPVDQPDRSIKVLLGAFIREANAQKLSSEISNVSIEGTLVTP